MERPELRIVRNRLKDINAALYDCPVEHCKLIPEAASVKLNGTGPWHTHLDGNRKGSWQNLISMCDGACVVYPSSHKMQWSHNGKCYVMSDSDKRALSDAGIKRLQVPMGIGDVLIMAGGELVHDVPAVPDDAEIRYMTFAHFSHQRGIKIHNTIFE